MNDDDDKIDNYGCFDCNVSKCPNSGYDEIPYPYCEMRPVEDFYKRKEAHKFHKKCASCAYRLMTSDRRCSPCNRCINRINQQTKG